MNPNQQRKLDQLEDELGVGRGTLPVEGEREDYVFTNVNGVTVLIPPKSSSPRGGYIVPALHTYHMSSLDAAIRAKELSSTKAPHNASTDIWVQSLALTGSAVTTTTRFADAAGNLTSEGLKEVLATASFCQRHHSRGWLWRSSRNRRHENMEER